MKNQGWIVAVGALLAVNAVQVAMAAPSEGLRLIETAPGTRAWMTSEQIGRLALRSHEEGHCGGYIDVTDHAEAADESRMTALVSAVTDLPAPKRGELVNRLLPELSADRMLATVEKLSSFHTRYYKSQTGVQAAQWIRDQFVAMAKGRTDITVELFNHARFAQPSVIARIQGKGPHAQERIVIGAHEDSINQADWFSGENARAPGADDDASGVSTVLEIFRVLTESGHQPDRTIEFMTYAGEEAGLLGSQDIAQSYKQKGAQVVGVLQLDMTFYPGNDPKIHMISDNTDVAMTRYTERLIDTYVHVPWVEMKCGYACSDHASWMRAGFPSSFPFEAPMDAHDPKIHTDKDLANILTPSFGLHFAKIGAAYAIEMGNP